MLFVLAIIGLGVWGFATRKTVDFSNYSWFPDLVRDTNFFRIPIAVASGIVSVESGGSAKAKNGDAFGLMQIRPIVVEEYRNVTGSQLQHAEMLEPEHNLRVGLWYLARLRDHYGFGTLTEMLLAYNSGLGAVRNNQGVNYDYPAKVFKAAGVA